MRKSKNYLSFVENIVSTRPKRVEQLVFYCSTLKKCLHTWICIEIKKKYLVVIFLFLKRQWTRLLLRRFKWNGSRKKLNR